MYSINLLMDYVFYLFAGLTFLVAGVISFASTPAVKKFAYLVGAVDVPKDNRRMHKVPIPRLGGLAIFLGFLVAILIFGEIDRSMTFVLIGALIIVTLGILDDILALKAFIKLIVQFIAAAIPVVFGGLQIEALSNLNPFSLDSHIMLGIWSIPVTLIWIVGITNAVNWIDGLDGLAAGVSSIAAITLLIVSCILADPYVVIVMAALAGACIGFMPYNINPAKMFMGDTGATFLGFILATMSIQGLFKFYAVVSFAVPFLILGLPLFDMVLAVARRLLSGRSPAAADREHVHHKLVDMGFNQKQSVAILYTLSGILGLSAVVLTSSGEIKAMLLLAAVLLTATMGFRVLSAMDKKQNHSIKPGGEDDDKKADSDIPENEKQSESSVNTNGNDQENLPKE